MKTFKESQIYTIAKAAFSLCGLHIDSLYVIATLACFAGWGALLALGV